MHTIFDAITTRLHLTEKNSQIDNKFPLQPISNLFTLRSQLKLAKMEWSGKWYKGKRRCGAGNPYKKPVHVTESPRSFASRFWRAHAHTYPALFIAP